MASLGLVNIGALATGILASPRLDADAILVEHGRIAALGAGSRTGAEAADVVVDCRGTTVIPGPCIRRSRTEEPDFATRVYSSRQLPAA